MSDDNPLEQLLRSTRRRVSSDQPAQPATGESGLNPLDLLSLPSAQREVVTWLSRQKRARKSEIQQAVGKETAEVEEILNALKQSGYVHESFVEGEAHYHVAYKGTPSRAARGLPQDIWARVDLDNTAFLRQISLFADLSDDELRDIANKMQAQHYNRNEVILWQGDLTEGVYFIKNGIVGVTRLSSSAKDMPILSYLKQGDVFVEAGLIAEQVRSLDFTATALSEVDVLFMKRHEFFRLLQGNANIAIELAKLLAQRLLMTTARIGIREKEAHVCLVFGMESGVGCTMLGNALARVLAETTGSPTVYTEYPSAHQLPRLFAFEPGTEIYKHPNGYDIAVAPDMPNLPPTLRSTLVMDQLLNTYQNVVIGLPARLDETVNYIVERATQIVLVTTPELATKDKIENFSRDIRVATYPERTSIVAVVNQRNEATGTDDETLPDYIGFKIPYIASMPDYIQQTEPLPIQISNVVMSLSDKLRRTNQVSVYIPATAQDTPDTSSHVDEMVNLLARLFGQSTSKSANWVWNNDNNELVNEAIYIVQSHVTQSDLDEHLPQILRHVEKLKQILGREAMAVQINQKYMLV
jgi:CRP-like cAMP-binding protein